MLGVLYQRSSTHHPFADRCAGHVSGASLGAFRIAFGLVGVVSAVRLVAHGWATGRYAGPAQRFTYLGFGWVPKPSTAAMVVLLAVVAAAASLVMVGWWYRPAIVVFFVGFTWVELIDVTTYLNHYWFVSLAALLLCFLPADASLSMRAWREGERTVALGAVYLLRAQVAVVYGFAGLAKLNEDWLVHALPLRLWLPARDGVIGLDALLDERWLAHVLSLAGATFDCAVVPLLLWRRTRPYAFVAVVVFHLLTWRLFAIGVFPWLMIAGATLFFAPDWPRRRRRADPVVAADHAMVSTAVSEPSGSRRASRMALAAGVAWIALQIAIPLRHHLYPGDARWTNEGYRFSWNVLATERAGEVAFRLTDPDTGVSWVDDARHLYSPDQWSLMATEPDLIHQAALALAREARADGHARVQVRADAFVSLNGRPAARLVDPMVDLAAERRDLWHDEWIEPGPAGGPP